MSLHHIAQHLKDQGRGPDDMLVHMTSGEVKALQGLAQAHGGSLSINPKTGLPEAGILSTVLPMALGAVAVATGQVEFLPLIAAGVGVADYAITGSLTQGLMAGLGTWSGGTMAAGFGAAGAAEMVAEGANAGATAFEQANQAALTAGTAQSGTEAALTSQQIQAQNAINATNFPNYSPEQINALRADSLNAANQGEFLKAVGQGNASLGSNVVNPTTTQNLSNMGSGLSSIGSVVKANPGAALGVAAPLLTGSTDLFGTKKGSIPGTTAQKNPFGLKEIPRDENGNPIFKASIPEQPNPAYQPVYPNYVANPYKPVGAADGGLMADKAGPLDGVAFSQQDGQSYDNGGMTSPVSFADGGMPYVQQAQNQPATANGYTPAGGGSTYGQGQFSPQTTATQPMSGLPMMMPATFADGGMAKYAGKYGSMVSGLQDVQEGAEMATRRPLMDTPRAEFGVYEDESDIRTLDPYNRTQALLKKAMTASHVKPSKGLPKGAVLGAIDMTPAQQLAAEQKAKESIAQESSTEAKEGGLMTYDAGGTTAINQQNTQQNAGLPQVGNLPDLVYQVMSQGSPTAASQAMQPQQFNQSLSSGLPQMNGVYQPEYINYAANPYNPQTAQQYTAPVAAPMAMSGGYQIDPLKMQGSPAYNAEQARIAAEQAAEAERQTQIAMQSSYPAYSEQLGGGAKAGGLMHSYAIGGGVGHLGGYSDGGRLLRGPGDGVSDSIPATIGGKQPARLAEGEFVIPARIVSELGNGSTDAGAKRLYAMMDRIKTKRSKTKNIAADTKAYKYLPA